MSSSFKSLNFIEEEKSESNAIFLWVLESIDSNPMSLIEPPEGDSIVNAFSSGCQSHKSSRILSHTKVFVLIKLGICKFLIIDL